MTSEARDVQVVEIGEARDQFRAKIQEEDCDVEPRIKGTRKAVFKVTPHGLADLHEGQTSTSHNLDLDNKNSIDTRTASKIRTIFLSFGRCDVPNIVEVTVQRFLQLSSPDLKHLWRQPTVQQRYCTVCEEFL